MSEHTEILDAFMDRLQQQNLVIVPKSFIEEMSGKNLIKKQRQYLANKSLTVTQISEAQLWGKITEVRVRQLILSHCQDGEWFALKNGNKRVIRSGVERIAKMRNVVWQV